MQINTAQPLVLHRDKLTQKIAHFWDQISEGWQEIWGPHIHHGYYEPNFAASPLQAQQLLIEKLSLLLDLKPKDHILDVGCGLGGSSLYLAEKYQASVTGITLSPKQVAIATQQAQERSIKLAQFKIEDALTLTSQADNSFDFIWSLESCEQFFDKKLFLQQAFRVLKPGGKLMLATWCSDQEQYGGKLAKKYRRLCLAFDLPYMPTIKYYQSLLTQQNFQIQQTLDWTKHVKPSWDIGISLLRDYNFVQLLKMGGWRGYRFVKQIKLMRDAFNEERVKYAIFLATKS